MRSEQDLTEMKIHDDALWATVENPPDVKDLDKGHVVKIRHAADGQRFWVTIMRVEGDGVFTAIVGNDVLIDGIGLGDWVRVRADQILEFPGRRYDIRETLEAIEMMLTIPRARRLAIRNANLRVVT